MNRYVSVNRFVNQVTNNEALKTFFTLLLMAQNGEQKKQVEQDFWQLVETLNVDDKEILLSDYRQTLPQLLQMSRVLHAEVRHHVQFISSKAA